MRIRQTEENIDRVYAETLVREAGFVMAAHHCHPYYELFGVERGVCRFLAGEQMLDLHSGDLLLIPPQVLHYTRYLFGACRRSAVFFRAEDVEEGTAALLPGGREFFTRPRVLQIPVPHQEQAAAHFQRMAAESRLGDARSPLLLHAQLQELLLRCGRDCQFPGELPAELHTSERSILLAARYIREHYRQRLCTAEIAAHAGFSPNYLTRKFREAAGIGLHEYLALVRLQAAAGELLSTRDSVTEIALRCGFSDSNYFKDAFKKHYGLTPRAYRRAEREGE